MEYRYLKVLLINAISLVGFNSSKHIDEALRLINPFHTTVSFYTPLEHQKMFSGDIERDEWHKMN